MFTGLIESIGEVVAIQRQPALTEMTVRTGRDLAGVMAVGDSLAVQGICLTLTRLLPDGVTVQAMPETVLRTSLSYWQPGQPVNLERALAVNGRLHGHWVTGHVDATGQIQRIVSQGNGSQLDIALPPALAKFVAVKGSIAVDGISLTVMAVTAISFRVSCIPHTLGHTTLKRARIGDWVNLEVDVLARYLDRLQSVAGVTDEASLSLEKLELLGF